MNRNNRVLELIIVSIQAACLLVPIALAVRPLNPLMLLVASVVGSCLYGYVGLQTSHLFCGMKKAVHREKVLFNLYRSIAIVSLLCASIAMCFATISSNNYDRAYLDNINSKLENKEFSSGLGDSSKFTKFCEEISLDYYRVQTILDLFGEDAKVIEERAKNGEGAYLQLPTYFSDNPIILDMVYTHYNISSGDLAESQVSDEVDRIGDMAASILVRSVICCGIVLITVEVLVITIILAIFSKWAINRNTKYLKEIEKNEAEKSKTDDVDTTINSAISSDSSGNTSHTEEE